MSAEEKVAGVSKWKQTFVFDRYGNRTLDAANTTTLVSSNAVTNPSVNEANNRLNDYTYDAAGNLTVDAENKRFVYDAENHQTKLFLGANNSNSPDAVYQYDGEGRRVVKISAHEKTVFVYDGGAQLVAEYTAWTAPDPAPSPQVSYLTQDHLGSTRVITNNLGQVIKRSDYMAYGDEVITANRSSANGYEQPSETRKGYTGYERDIESGLDFAQARYYNPQHGRFTSVDPLTASANVKDPQTFNRYTYALNSPYKFTDPLGLAAVDTGMCAQWCPGSGQFVDGSAIGGIDTTYDSFKTGNELLREWWKGVEAQSAGISDQALIAMIEFASSPPPAQGQVSHSQVPIFYNFVVRPAIKVAVKGADFDEVIERLPAAISEAERNENKKNGVTGSFCNESLACVVVERTVRSRKLGIVITLTMQPYLPEWSNVDSATPSDRNRWALFYADAVRHEDGHIYWYTQLEVFLGARAPAGVRTASQLENSKEFKWAYDWMLGWQHRHDVADLRRISQQPYWNP